VTLLVGPVDVDDPARHQLEPDRLAVAGAFGTDAATTAAQVLFRRHQLLGLVDRVVPVRWDADPDTDGWYRVDGVTAELDSFYGDEAEVAWSLELHRLVAVEFVSKLTGNGRQRDAGWPAPERWAAPPRGHDAMFAGAGVSPTRISRTGAGGAVHVYRNLPDVDPRWRISLDGFYAAAATLRHDTRVVTGRRLPDTAAGWQLDNDLVRVRPAGNGRLLIAGWHNGAWRETAFEVRTGATPVAAWHGITVLRNDPEEVAVKLLRDHNPGRLTVDLKLRRGSRYVSLFLQRHTATDLTVAVETPAAATAFTGGIRRTDLDAGVRWVIASARAANPDAPNGALTKTAARTFDAMVAVTPDAQAGDAPADLLAQYIGHPEERVEVIRR